MSRRTFRAAEAGTAPPTYSQQPAKEGDGADTVVVEEIFLEGDSMTMLRHEAGSTRTIGLLATADVLDPTVGQRK